MSKKELKTNKPKIEKPEIETMKVEYERVIKSGAVTMYLLYDENEQIEIEEKICNKHPDMTKLINECAIKRELGEDELKNINLNDINGYIFQGYGDLIKELKENK